MDPSDRQQIQDIVRTLRRIFRHVSQHSKRLSRNDGLTLPQVVCMRAVGDAPDKELTVAALARTVQLSPATVSGVIDRLERAGLMRRERWSSDRRKVSVSLTDLGRRRLDTLPQPLQERFIERLAELDIGDRATLLDNLELVVRLMEAEQLDASPILIPDEHVD